MMQSRTSTTRFVLFLVVFALAVRFAFFFWGGVTPFQGADSHSYYSLAQNFARGEGLRYVDNGSPVFVLASFRPPLYPLFVGIVFKIFGDRTSPVLVFQLLFGVLSVVVLFAAARRLFNDAVAKAAAVIGASYWISMYWENQIYTESLFCLLFLVANYFAITVALRSESKGVAWHVAAAGLFYGLAVLCRPSAVMTMPLVFGWIVALRVRTDKRVLAEVMVMFALWIVVLLPWWIRNYAIHQTFVPFVSSGGLNFWAGNRVAEGANSLGAAWEIMKTNPQGFTETQIDRWFYQNAFEVLARNPGHFLAALKDKFVWYWWPLQSDVYQIPYRLLFPFCLIGLGASLRYLRQSSVLYLIILSQCAVSVLYNAHSRYRYSIDFYLVLVAAVGVVGLANVSPGGRRWIGPLSVLLLVALGVLGWELDSRLLPILKLWHIVPVALAFVAVGYLGAHKLQGRRAAP